MEKKSDAIVARAVQRAAGEMAREYAAERSRDAERLHEAFAETIATQRPNVEVLVFVLRLLEQEVLTQKARDLFGQAGEPAEIPHTPAPNGVQGAYGLAEAPLR